MLRYFSYLVPLMLLGCVLFIKTSDLPALQYIQLRIFDEFQIRHPREYKDAGVTIIDIDDESLSRLGQWPWSRELLARLVDKLTASGAAAVGFDMVFAEADRTSPHLLVPQWNAAHKLKWPAKNLPDYDALFAKSLADAPAVMGFTMSNESALPPILKSGMAFVGGDPKPMAHAYVGAVSSLPSFVQAAKGNGSFNTEMDPDGVIRRVPLVVRAGNQLYPSLAVESLRVAQGASSIVIRGVGGENGAEASAMTDVKIGQFSVPTDKHGRMWVYFTPYQKERYLPAWKVLEADFDPAQVVGKILILGTSAPGLKDMRSTPLDPVTSGVELHAQALEQMILGEFINRPDWMAGAEVVLMLAIALVVIFAVKRFSPMWGAVVTFTAIAASFYISVKLFYGSGLIVEPVTPSLAVLIIYLAESLLKAIMADRERKRVRDAFSHYMSPALVEQLAANPDKLKLGGEARNMSVMFSDIRDFTSISERMSAEELTTFINRYLTPMSEVVLKYNGTIDKYIGDCIMAFWNAPLDDGQHARHACESALAMLKALHAFNDELRAASLPGSTIPSSVHMGIGINTGECSVGNMGSNIRFDYSVLGDNVNLASRLEGQCKEYGVPIIIGEATRAAVADFAAIELDLIKVKGKKQAVRIFALLGDAALATRADFLALADCNNDLLAAYRARRWDEAAKHSVMLDELAQKAGAPLRELVALHQERIVRLKASPPAAEWDGVFVATSK